MATNIKISLRYITHLPCLIKAMEKTSGDVLELGIGVGSTPYLHYKCILDGRKLVSYENFKPWYDFFTKRYGYNYSTHELNFVEKYADVPLKKYDIVFIDQTPDWSRHEEAIRFANHAKYVIIHDSGSKFDKQYQYDKVYPHFKYKTVWDGDTNQATVLSNFIDLTNFWK
jgi:hypothetical protein